MELCSATEKTIIKNFYISKMMVILLVLSVLRFSACVDLFKMLSNALEKKTFDRKCLEGLGCFDTGYPFKDPNLRPISFAPFDLDRMRTKFLLFTRRNMKKPYDLDRYEKSLNNSPFNEENPTKFIVHGYLRYLSEDDNIHRMKTVLLEHGDYNVFIVDWSSSNGYPYAQAVANTRVVGAQIAQMIQYLQNNRGITPQSIHIIGHSLGSHIAGYTGERIPHIARITGLDPAGPYFAQTEKEVRLDPTDADFVDVMHTDVGEPGKRFGWGTPDSVGHLDFYINGGKDQPACEKLSVNTKYSGLGLTYVDMVLDGGGIYTLLFCDHFISEEYLIATIKDICTFVGTSCNSYEHFLKGRCSLNKKVKMGYFAEKPSSHMKLFLQTTNTPPLHGC